MLNVMSVVKWLAPNHVVHDPFLEGENASFAPDSWCYLKEKKGKGRFKIFLCGLKYG